MNKGMKRKKAAAVKKIGCQDLGSSCGFEAKAANLDQLVPLLEDHARIKHDLRILSLDLEDQVRDKARTESKNQKD